MARPRWRGQPRNHDGTKIDVAHPFCPFTRISTCISPCIYQCIHTLMRSFVHPSMYRIILVRPPTHPSMHPCIHASKCFHTHTCTRAPNRTRILAPMHPTLHAYLHPGTQLYTFNCTHAPNQPWIDCIWTLHIHSPPIHSFSIDIHPFMHACIDAPTGPPILLVSPHHHH